MKILDVAGLVLLTVAGVLVFVPVGLGVAGLACLWVSRWIARGDAK